MSVLSSNAKKPQISANFVCPKCRGPLAEFDDSRVCRNCGAAFSVADGLSYFVVSDEWHGEFSQNEMKELLGIARRDGWRRAVQNYALPRRPNVAALITDERRRRVPELLEGGPARRVLDIGCGYGAVSVHLARAFGEVFALDQTKERVAFLNEICKQGNIKNIIPIVHEGVVNLPFSDAFFDAIIMVGVFEYLPLSISNLPTWIAHRKCLSEFHRILRPGGQLLIATKNRYSLAHFSGEADHNGLAFGPILPQAVADLLLRSFRKKRYRIINYSLRNYRRLFEQSGFTDLRFFWPFPGYQMPEVIAAIEHGASLLASFPKGYFPPLKQGALSLLDRVGLLQHVVREYVVLGSKCPTKKGS